MYAYIRYFDDPNTKHIVSTSSIKDFDGVNYDCNKCYFVWWPTEDSGACSNRQGEGYWPAQVLLVKESRDALLVRINTSRIPIPKLPELPDTLETPQINSAADKEPKTKVTKVNAAAKRDLASMLTKNLQTKRRAPLMEEPDSDLSIDEGSSDDELIPKKEFKKKEEEVAFWKARCKRLRELNDKLQEALATNVLKAEEIRSSKCNVPGTQILPSPTVNTPSSTPITTSSVTKKKISNLASRVNDNTPSSPLAAQTLSHQLQPNLSVQSPSPLTSTLPSNISQVAPNDTLDVAQPSTSDCTKFQIVENLGAQTVDIGGCQIPLDKWQHILVNAKNSSVFCKSLAVILWTPDTLCERSLTGTICNANKNKIVPVAAKKALTPKKVVAVTNAARHFLDIKGQEKLAEDVLMSNVQRYLKEKMSDINKNAKKNLRLNNV